MISVEYFTPKNELITSSKKHLDYCTYYSLITSTSTSTSMRLPDVKNTSNRLVLSGKGLLEYCSTLT